MLSGGRGGNGTKGAAMAEIAPTLNDVLESIDAGRVLEVGCGDGEFTEILVENLGAFDSIYAVDVEDSSLDEARNYFAKAHPGSAVTFRNADATKLPLSTASFDTGAISNSLHHMAQPEEALGELVRVLRPGGRLIINEMIADVEDPRQQVGRDLHHLKARVDRTKGIGHNRTLTRAVIDSLLDSLNLQHVERHEYDRVDIDTSDVDLEGRLDHIDGYIEHAAWSSDYASIRREATRLKQRIRTVGFDAPPQRLIIARKPTEQDGGVSAQ
jgi:SAM-dependent methyltransferase